MAESAPYYQQYVSIDAPEAQSFIAEALSSATAFLGDPDIAVSTVHLRYSVPVDSGSNLRRGFQLTEVLDAEKGIFVIYLSRTASDYAYHGQLSHEVAHLIDARMYDAYIEGANTLFSEIFLKSRGLDWSGWQKYFNAGEDPFYSSTYFLMKEIYGIVGSSGIKSLMSYSVWTDKEKTRKHIDIKRWIKSLPLQQQKRVRRVIMSRAASVKKAMEKIGYPVMFVLPK